MYNNENNKRKLGKTINIILGIIALFIIIFIIAWLINKSNSSNNNYNNNNATFDKNLNTIHEVSKDIFAEDLPQEVGATKKITLSQLYELNLVDKMTYGNTDCDQNNSFISITKINSKDYQVKSTLICGNKKDTKTETITSKVIIDDDNTTNNDNNNNTDIPGTNVDNEDPKKPAGDLECNGLVCSFNEIPTTCNTTYEYEYVKRNSKCDEGYTLVNGSCVKTDTKKPNISYVTSVTDAKVNVGGSYKEYADLIKTTTTKCQNGTLEGNICKITIDLSYQRVPYCSSYGYNILGNQCVNYSQPTQRCTSGELINGKCYIYQDKEENIELKASCPSGYTKSGSGDSAICYKYVDAKKTYSKWGNPTKIYATTTKESVYTKELEQKVELSHETKYGITTYKYAIYNRSVSYTCSNGKTPNSNHRCYMTTNPTITYDTSTSCPAGTTPSGNRCYRTTTPTSYCLSGNLVNGVCMSTQNISYKTNSYCSGYTDASGRCYTTATPVTTTEYKCPDGYTKEGTGATAKCYKVIKSDDKYYCEDKDAKLDGNKCYKQIKKTSCDNGYQLTSDNMCTYKITKPLTWTNSEYFYDKNPNLLGYQKTGVKKFITVCTRISK